MELKEIIAKNLYTLRTDSGLTQLGLAEKLNYSDKAVSKWERAESVPDIFMLKRIADFFGVSVDYLLTLDHKKEIAEKREKNPLPKQAKLMISFLAASLVWLIATLVFVVINIAAPDGIFRGWLVFIYAIPISSIVILVFNSIWGRKRLNYIIISVLVWTLILSIYISVLILSPHNIWLIFLLGIPAEIIIILWAGMGFKKKKNKKEKEIEK